MKKKQINARKNKTSKQQKAFNKLTDARQQGPWSVLKVLLAGNRFIRQVVEGKHLMEGIKRFILDEWEEAAVKQHMHQQAEKFRDEMQLSKEMKELLAWAVLKDIEILSPFNIKDGR